MNDSLAIGGMARLVAECSDPDAVIIKGMARTKEAALAGDLETDVALMWTEQPNGMWKHNPLYRHNAFVRNGLNAVAERMFGIGTTAALTRIYLSADAQAVTLATVLIDPAGGATGVASKVFSPAASLAPTTSIVTAGATFTQADVAFSIQKMGLSNAATDLGTTTPGAIAGIWDIIGGAGIAPYDQDFIADYTGSTTFTLTPSIDCTIAAT